MLSPARREVILIRHGTTEMNEHLASHEWGSDDFTDAMLFDTRLSKRGVAEAKALNDRFSGADPMCGRIELLVSSPLTRALQTSEHAFAGAVLSPAVPRVVLPLASERVYMSSEVGRLKADLAKDFPAWDYGLLGDNPWWFAPEPGDSYEEWRPRGKYACAGEPQSAFSARMVALRAWLCAREERVVCLVCHWGVARALSGQSFENCGVQSFALDDLLREPFIDKY